MNSNELYKAQTGIRDLMNPIFIHNNLHPNIYMIQVIATK